MFYKGEIVSRTTTCPRSELMFVSIFIMVVHDN